MNNRIVLLLFMVMLFVQSCLVAEPQKIFVSENGDDGQAGTKDLPLSSMDAALKMTEDVKRTDQDKPVEIYLLPGTYYLNSPLKIGPKIPAPENPIERRSINTAGVVGSVRRAPGR